MIQKQSCRDRQGRRLGVYQALASLPSRLAMAGPDGGNHLCWQMSKGKHDDEAMLLGKPQIR